MPWLSALRRSLALKAVPLDPARTMEIGGLQLECAVCRYDLFHARQLLLANGSRVSARGTGGRFSPLSAVACDRCGAVQLFDAAARSSPSARVPASRTAHVRHRRQAEQDDLPDPEETAEDQPEDVVDEPLNGTADEPPFDAAVDEPPFDAAVDAAVNAAVDQETDGQLDTGVARPADGWSGAAEPFDGVVPEPEVRPAGVAGPPAGGFEWERTTEVADAAGPAPGPAASPLWPAPLAPLPPLPPLGPHAGESSPAPDQAQAGGGGAEGPDGHDR